MALDIKAYSRFFFDRAEVRDAVDRGTRRALSKFGAFVRRRARTSIRKKKGISEPGKPPNSHLGLLRKGILFAFDPSAKSVVIGPVPMSKPNGVPELLEKGGTVPGNGREIWVTNTPGRNAQGQFVSKGKTRVVLDGNLVYRPRPYMGPAYQAELPKAPQMFKDAIR